MMFLPNFITEFLQQTASIYPNKTAVVSTNETITWKMLNDKSDYLAKTLLQYGIQRGDRVMICLDNSIETVTLFWATLKIKAVAVILNPETPMHRLNWILQDSGAKILWMRDVENKIYGWLRKKSQPAIKLPEQPDIVWMKLLQETSHAVLPMIGIDLDLACIIYTSGSTGMPKGVMLTHQNMFAAACSLLKYLQYRLDDKIISALPLSFDYGLYQIILAAMVGASIVLEKGFTWPLQFLTRIEASQATIFPAVATQFAILAKHQKHIKQVFSSVRMITNTGTTLFPQQIEFAQQLFPSAKIFSMYGLTECKRCTYLPPDELLQKMESVGKAIPNTEIWIIDESGNKLLPFEEGQLVVRGATVMRGYWNNEIETKRMLHEGPLSGEKILYTGDYGYLDQAGYFYFRGRRDDTIKRYSEKVNIKSIESTIRLLPEIDEICVLAIANEVSGADIIVFVTTQQSRFPTENISFHCKEILPRSHWPTAIYCLDELPRSLNGKYDKAMLRAYHDDAISGAA